MENNLLSRAVTLLHLADPVKKAERTCQLARDWQNRKLVLDPDKASPVPPEQPGRPANLEQVAPGAVPKRRVGTAEGRIALLHAIAHIELNAIDLALDMLARFTSDPVLSAPDRLDFATDWLVIASEEAQHFTLITNRLNEMGSIYGALAVHQGLWEAAHNTRHDLAARLAIAPMLLEARGLDVTPSMIKKLIGAGDTKSAHVLKIIYEEEIGHVAKGVHWFKIVCAARNVEPQHHFKTLVQQYFPAGLRAPFNHSAREMAGLTRGYYQTSLA
ncbi:MAG: rhamnosyltransferase [Robiginitomaculum sp.]|nr:MAG: rhamnosyltransferase [Robiginitomaculum sp.]